MTIYLTNTLRAIHKIKPKTYFVIIFYHLSKTIDLGIVHILRNHQGGEGGLWNDYANVIFALSNAEFDYGRGRGSRNRQKVIT